MNNPTIEIYDFLSSTFDRINDACFDNSLPRVVITVKGKGRTFGYYKAKAYISHDGTLADELAVNPAYFATHGFQELLQTPAHEMCHQWQHLHGLMKSNKSYHNREFATKMKSIGLMPSSTGETGGKETGQTMGDYMLDTGRLPELYNTLINAGVHIPWYERIQRQLGAVAPDVIEAVLADNLEAVGADADNIFSVQTLADNTTRSRYRHACSSADKEAIIYGKKGLYLICGDCNKPWNF